MIGSEDTEFLDPVIGSLPFHRFRPVTTIWFASFQLFLVVCYALAAVLLIFLWPKSEPACESLYLLMYCHSALWFIVLIFDHYLKWKHHLLRLDGYLDAYEKMTKYGSLPFFIVSLGMCLMTVVSSVYLQLRMIPLHCTKNEFTSPLIISLGVILLESGALAYVIIVYIVFVLRLNNVRPAPDVDDPDVVCSMLNNLMRDEVGFRERGEVMEELLQNQADLIRYYRDANEVLKRKVMGLTAQLRGDSIN